MSTEQKAPPMAFTWLKLVMSEKGPADPLTKLVLCAIFERVDWETGREFFEGSRKLSKRLALNKDTVNDRLARAARDGWLTRRKCSCTDNAGNERKGYAYSIAFPRPLSDAVGQQQQSHCPVSAAPLSGPVDSTVRPGRTHSPLNPHESKRAQNAQPRQSLRSCLISAAKRPHERQAFEHTFPEAVPHLRAVGGWTALGRSNEECELPGLIARVIGGIRGAAAEAA